MPDKEKVTHGLECCCLPGGHCNECPYVIVEGFAECTSALAKDALALLKEQEAKQVIKQTYHVMMNRDYENPVEATRYDWLCPTCKSLLCRDIDVIDDNYHFCKVCGQAVKWE